MRYRHKVTGSIYTVNHPAVVAQFDKNASFERAEEPAVEAEKPEKPVRKPRSRKKA